MLEKYKGLIYKSDDERKQAERRIFEECFTAYPELSADDYINADDERLPPDLRGLYYRLLEEYEGNCLFELAVNKFGKSLWLNGAWGRKWCKRRCPFGNVCRKELYEYKGKRYCYGQIYLRVNPYLSDRLKNDYIFSDYSIIFSDGKRINSEKILKAQGMYLSSYETFISEFGEKDSTGKINGRNVIPFLKR